MTIAACATAPALVVTKTVFTTGGTPADKITLSDGDTLQFAISIENRGGETIAVDYADTFPAQFTDGAAGDPTWTRTGPTGTVTTGSGAITGTNVSIGAGLKVTYLVSATFEPAACDSLVTNVVSAVLNGDTSCCDENTVYAAAQVVNADGPKVKLDPVGRWTAMEAIYYLLENVTSLADRVTIADYVNNSCGNLAGLISGGGGGGSFTPDGAAVEMTDAFGAGTGDFAETSVGS